MGSLLICFFLTWQQQVNYQIKASLDTAAQILTGVEQIVYHNHAPDTLDTIYFHLYPNAFQNQTTVFARELRAMGVNTFDRAPHSDRGSLDIQHVRDNREELIHEVRETIMAVTLIKPVGPEDSVVLSIDFQLHIPKIFSRLGREGRHYEIVQWYPKPCVYDYRGWHCEPFHALGEFYGEYGSFDVAILVPRGYMVAATGEMTASPDTTAGNSDAAWTFRFYADSVHDFAWIADPDFRVQRSVQDGVTIECYYHPDKEKSWSRATEIAAKAIGYFAAWIGSYPYQTLRVVQGSIKAGGGMEYPGLVVIAADDNPVLNSFEQTIVHEIAHQWFYAALGSDELNEAWLDEGFATYAAMRFFEDRDGPANSIFKSRFLPPMTDLDYNRLLYHVAVTNGFATDGDQPAYEYIAEPFSYMAGFYVKPALLLRHLEGTLGRPAFDEVIRTYYQRYRFRHPRGDDFLAIGREIGGADFPAAFGDAMRSSRTSNWRIAQVQGPMVRFENRGQITLPVDALIKSDQGDTLVRLDSARTTIMVLSARRIKSVEIDPARYALDADYADNHYPRKFRVQPLLALPALDEYRVYIFPYLWYSTVEGFTPGLYLAGSRFFDWEFIRGDHQWLAGGYYGLRSRRPYGNIQYQTPIWFQRGFRCRLMGGGGWSREQSGRLGMEAAIGVPFTARPSWKLKSTLNYRRIDPVEIDSFAAFDSTDWDAGAYATWETSVQYRYQQWSASIDVAWSPSFAFTDWDYGRITIEIKTNARFLLPVGIRLFGGLVTGNAPKQQQLYLSGNLQIPMIPDLLFSQQGYFSPQEHIHIPGSGNLRGFQTMHTKTDGLVALNCELPSRRIFRFFGDIAAYRLADGWKNAWDWGIRVVLGPVSFNVPVHANGEKVWKARWSIGF